MVKEAALGTSGYAVASLITGVISLILGWVPILGWGVLLFTYIFAFLGLRDINKKKRKGKAIAISALALAVLGTILAALVLFAALAGYTQDTTPQTPSDDALNEDALNEDALNEDTLNEEALNEDTPSSDLPLTNGIAPSSQSSVWFSPGIINTFAIINEPFNFSFCDPQTLKPSDLCDPGNRVVSNPRGGNPPYHFTIDHGFFHTGLILHPNGYLDGTPKTAGSITVDVCATDLSGNTACEPDTLDVIDMGATLDSARCVLEDCGSNGFCVWRLTLSGTARGPEGTWVYPDGSGVEAIGSSMTYDDPEMDYTCGTWTPDRYATRCTNPTGKSATSYTFVYTIVSDRRSVTLTPRVAMTISYKSEMRDTSFKTKTVTCS